MKPSDMQAGGTQPGISLWAVLICVNKLTGYGSFTTLMNHPPVEGRTLEFYETPEGNFSGTIFRVHESVKFSRCQEMKLDHSFGLADQIKVLPSIIEYQVFVDVTNSSQLSHFGIPEL